MTTRHLHSTILLHENMRELYDTVKEAAQAVHGKRITHTQFIFMMCKQMNKEFKDQKISELIEPLDRKPYKV